MKNEKLREQCRELRAIHRLSIRDIHNQTGVSKGTLSSWLQDIPLTKEEKTAKRAQRPKQPKKEKPQEESKFQRMLVPGLSSRQKGKIAESAILFRLVLKNFTVFGSPFDGDRSDWLVDTGEKLYRIQVKLLQGRELSLRRTDKKVGQHCRYKPGEFDFIIGYSLMSDTAYVYSETDVSNHRCAILVTEPFAEKWEKLKK